MTKILLMFSVALPVFASQSQAGGAASGGCGGCSIWMILGCVGWLILTSILVYFTWNKVIKNQFKSLKEVPFWHALLFMTMIAAFCCPRYMMKRGKYKKNCKDCHHKSKVIHNNN